jgi:hypothetical protein
VCSSQQYFNPLRPCEFCFYDHHILGSWRFAADIETWVSEDIEAATQCMSKMLTCGVYYMIALRGPDRWSESEWTRLGFDVALTATRQKIMDTTQSVRGEGDVSAHGVVRNFRFVPADAEFDEVRMKTLACLANKAGIGQEVLKEWLDMVRQ